MLAPFALHAAARCFIISAQQAALVRAAHETLFLWQVLSEGVHEEGAWGQIVKPFKNTDTLPMWGGGEGGAV